MPLLMKILNMNLDRSGSNWSDSQKNLERASFM